MEEKEKSGAFRKNQKKFGSFMLGEAVWLKSGIAETMYTHPQRFRKREGQKFSIV